MASTSSALRGRREGLPSAKPSRGCRCGNRISRRLSATAPPRKPKATGTKRHAPHPAPASSSAGSSRDQNEAASITPAANPSMISSERRENSRGENTARRAQGCEAPGDKSGQQAHDCRMLQHVAPPCAVIPRSNNADAGGKQGHEKEPCSRCCGFLRFTVFLCPCIFPVSSYPAFPAAAAKRCSPSA